MFLFFASFVCALETATYLFTDAKYAEMTLAVANATYRLARRDPYAYQNRFFVTIWVLDDTSCRRFEPFFCVPLLYRDLDYQSMLEKRLTVMYAALQHPMEEYEGVMMIDSDVLLKRNVAARMATHGTDLVFQSEWPCAMLHCANGGVWWARARSVAALGVVKRALDLAKTMKISDQDALNVAISLGNASVTYLPATKYPNGFVMQANNRLDVRSVHLLHVNWCKLDRKAERLRQAAKAARFFAVPAETNATFVCKTLNALDTRQLMQILGCGGYSDCTARVQQRCR